MRLWFICIITAKKKPNYFTSGSSFYPQYTKHLRKDLRCPKIVQVRLPQINRRWEVSWLPSLQLPLLKSFWIRLPPHLTLSVGLRITIKSLNKIRGGLQTNRPTIVYYCIWNLGLCKVLFLRVEVYIFLRYLNLS